MQKLICTLCISLCFVGTLLGTAFAGVTGHFTNGPEGIKVANLPLPGTYYKMYNILYSADELKDANGNTLALDFDITSFVNVHRVLWVSNIIFLGADVAGNVLLPLVYTDLKIADDKYSKFAVGDIAAEAALAWHGSFYDAAAAFAIFAPIGEYNIDNPASPGKDMWSYMFTLGATYYFDTEKTWAFSIVPRYEMHGEKSEMNVTPGDDFHFEWGLSKAFNPWEIGVTGYCQWQVTDDSGSGVTWDKDVHDRVYGIGPEVMVSIPSLKATVQFRSQWEFATVDRSEGNITTLSFALAF